MGEAKRREPNKEKRIQKAIQRKHEKIKLDRERKKFEWEALSPEEKNVVLQKQKRAKELFNFYHAMIDMCRIK